MPHYSMYSPGSAREMPSGHDIALVQRQDIVLDPKHDFVLVQKQDIVLVQKQDVGPNLTERRGDADLSMWGDWWA